MRRTVLKTMVSRLLIECYSIQYNRVTHGYGTNIASLVLTMSTKLVYCRRTKAAGVVSPLAS